MFWLAWCLIFVCWFCKVNTRVRLIMALTPRTSRPFQLSHYNPKQVSLLLEVHPCVRMQSEDTELKLWYFYFLDCELLPHRQQWIYSGV